MLSSSLRSLDAKLEEHERRSWGAREAALQRTEIERYRAVEGERHMWEVWEARLNKRLEALGGGTAGCESNNC